MLLKKILNPDVWWLQDPTFLLSFLPSLLTDCQFLHKQMKQRTTNTSNIMAVFIHFSRGLWAFYGYLVLQVIIENSFFKYNIGLYYSSIMFPCCLVPKLK